MNGPLPISIFSFLSAMPLALFEAEYIASVASVTSEGGAAKHAVPELASGNVFVAVPRFLSSKGFRTC
jgi:hypothetical protein